MPACIASPILPHLTRPVGLPVQIDYMFDSARKSLELAAWNRLRKPWASAMDVETGRKFYYNTRTLESRWFMPILERQTGASLTPRLLRGHVVSFTAHLHFTPFRNDFPLSCYVAFCAVMSVCVNGHCGLLRSRLLSLCCLCSREFASSCIACQCLVYRLLG